MIAGPSGGGGNPASPPPRGTYHNPTPESLAAEVAAEARVRDEMAQEAEEARLTEQAVDIQTLIQAEIAKAIGSLTQDQPPLPTFEDVLAQVDPRDSEAALAMLDFLLTTGRLNRVGVLDGGQGYLFVYHEPKGTTKAGYRPGGTQGDRIVDAAVDKARADGKVPAKRGVCGKCVSAIYQGESDDTPRLEGEDDFTKAVVCAADGDTHVFA